MRLGENHGNKLYLKPKTNTLNSLFLFLIVLMGENFKVFFLTMSIQVLIKLSLFLNGHRTKKLSQRSNEKLKASLKLTGLG